MEARFWAKVDTSGDCWIWTGARDAYGYGRVCVPGTNGRHTIGAHRYAAMVRWGMFAKSTTVNHHCDTPLCVRHIYLGTQADNMADKKTRGRHYNTRKSACDNGHAFTPSNTYTDPNGHRACRECNRVRSAQYRKRVWP